MIIIKTALFGIIVVMVRNHQLLGMLPVAPVMVIGFQNLN